MPCNVNDNSLNPGAFPGTPIPGFGLPFSPTQLPIPNFEFPNFPEDLLELIDQLTTRWPFGQISPNIDDTANSILKALASIFNQIAPFLGMYRFFQAALNMILCLLEILCAFPNPFKMTRAMRRLFKRCLPNFLQLFPWLALLAMILALLALILALIEYIIARILQLIEDLIANLETLSRGLTLQDDDSVTATARKIAQLLCLIENLLSVLVAVGAILAIINALAGIRGRSACGGGRARGISTPSAGDDVNCCDDEVCPPFIAENPVGLSGIQGQLIYHRRIDTDVENLLGISSLFARQFNLPALRSERWQFVNNDTGYEFPFADIITPVGDGDIFFPEGVTFTNETKPRRVPYTLDITLRDFDPGIFIPSDTGGARTFQIKDIIITKKPYIGYLNYENEFNNDNNLGTLSLAGGLVFEVHDGLVDGVPYLINGEQATIENFFHLDPIASQLPNIEDGYFISDIEFLLRIRHEVLIDYGLITLGCHPDLFQERFVANTRVESVGFDAIAVKLPPVRDPAPDGSEFLPDAVGAHDCAISSITKLRQDISPENIQNFRAEIVACLEELRRQTSESFCNILRAGVSPFETSTELDNDLQFTTRPIIVKVQLKDPNGTIISNNIPPACSDFMETLLDGYATLGEISEFSYDGYDAFTAEITSKNAGDGILTISFDNNILKQVLNTDDDNAQTIIEDNILSYTFVSSSVVSKVSGTDEIEPSVRRDESDIVGDV